MSSTESTNILIPESPGSSRSGLNSNLPPISTSQTGLASKFQIVRLVGAIILHILIKFWKLCTTALLIMLLLYWFYGNLITFVLFIAAIIGLFYNSQDLLLYFPEEPSEARQYVQSPTSYGLPYENLSIKTRDGATINAYLVKQPSHLLANTYTVLFLHGNAGNIGHRLDNVRTLYSTLGVNVLMLEYRGYGKSTDTPSEKGLALDAQAGLDYLSQRTDIDPTRIVVFGRSLGGGVAASLLQNRSYSSRISAVMLENTFTDLPSIAKKIFDFRVIHMLPHFCYKNKYPTQKRLSQCTTPTLFLSGLADTLVPPKMMLNLYQTSGSRLKRLAHFTGGSHNQTWECPGYCEVMNKFLLEVTASLENPDIPASGVYSLAQQTPFHDGGVAMQIPLS